MINFSLYQLFLLVAIPTIMSPGPGVLMSLVNSVRLGVARALPGIIGVSVGTLVIAGISATGLGVLLATSPVAYDCVKIIGIAFMVYLGIKKFMAKPFDLSARSKGAVAVFESPARLFAEGIILQLSNPQLIVFYLSLFPQCIDTELDYAVQFSLLSVNYAVLVFLIHTCYGWIGSGASVRLLNENAGLWINRASGVAFLICAAVMAWGMI